MKNRTMKSNVGYTIFKPTGERHEFPQVDLVNQLVVGIVIYEGKTYMTVTVDVKTNNVKVEGRIDELESLSMGRDAYINMFKQEAKFFIENNILNPNDYYDELIKNQGRPLES
ncbi:hypothetical protein [Ureibacillus aquaedulcis]|uniref:IDEAL domain-containing protein n=1 Tax=Ureibacillus aquaedulcis TaxID=3058421 RepID=A0ABT8GMH6_9BACL|nr:hypothetical protein [Ureibacillus sp. BA0131]MDN4492559.1 hypothetical protein [Ureibacillus sp. BA0131]